jgi:hypothetical protein
MKISSEKNFVMLSNVIGQQLTALKPTLRHHCPRLKFEDFNKIFRYILQTAMSTVKQHLKLWPMREMTETKYKN